MKMKDEDDVEEERTKEYGESSSAEGVEDAVDHGSLPSGHGSLERR